MFNNNEIAELLNDSDYMEKHQLYQDFVKEAKRQQKINKDKKEAAQFQRDQKLRNGLNFEINLHFKEGGHNAKFDAIPLEGYDNALLVWGAYKKLGHSIGLGFMTMYLDDKKVKKLTFKY